jgi:MFS family permease
MLRILFNRVVLLAGLGFFVDVFDLFLFSVVRRPSLASIGITPEKMGEVGEQLLATQMWGMLLGGFLWGILGDKRGRLTVLLGSILTYSIATAANGLVTDLSSYHLCRFFAGLGLAGELGAGISLVMEQLEDRQRGIGAFLVATLGALGAVVAALMGDLLTWQTTYFLGGALGIALLLFRFGVTESAIFRTQESHPHERGALRILLNSENRKKYIGSVLAGVPIWFSAGLLVGFLPEIAQFHGISGIKVTTGLICFQAAFSVGDLSSGLISQKIQSRLKVLHGYTWGWLGTMVLLFVLLTLGVSPTLLYFLVILLGLFSGYMAVFVTAISEQFGTNVRNTASSTIINLMRGSVVLMVPLHLFLQHQLSLSLTQSLMAIALLVFGLSWWGRRQMAETFHISLRFVQRQKP